MMTLNLWCILILMTLQFHLNFTEIFHQLNFPFRLQKPTWRLNCTKKTFVSLGFCLWSAIKWIAPSTSNDCWCMANAWMNERREKLLFIKCFHFAWFHVLLFWRYEYKLKIGNGLERWCKVRETEKWYSSGYVSLSFNDVRSKNSSTIHKLWNKTSESFPHT